METRNLKINIETARSWYYSGEEILKELALKVFSVNELTKIFPSIKTFEDACDALELDYGTLKIYVDTIAKYSKASAAMFKLNIIRKALNLGRDLHLTKAPEGSYIYYPCNPFIAETSTYCKKEIDSGKLEIIRKLEIIGKIKCKGTIYNVINGNTYGGFAGLGDFCSRSCMCNAPAATGFLGCASKEIAEHFGRHFGMLITEAKYGDMVDFKIISSKYLN